MNRLKEQFKKSASVNGSYSDRCDRAGAVCCGAGEYVGVQTSGKSAEG